MKFFKKLFGLKEKEEKINEEFPEEVQEEKVEEVLDGPICYHCGLTIGPNHDKRTYIGKKFHKVCLRSFKKEAIKGAGF